MGEMKRLFHRLLFRLDRVMERRNSREQMLFLITPALVLGYLSFQWLVPMAVAFDDAKAKSYEKAEQNIRLYKRLLSSRGESGVSFIEALQEQNEKLKERFEKQRRLDYFLEAGLDTLPNLYFTDRIWSESLDGVAQSARDVGVRVQSVRNRRLDLPSGEFGEVMQVDVNATGRFDQVMGYLSRLESGKRIAQISGLFMEGGDRLYLGVELTYWGVRP